MNSLTPCSRSEKDLLAAPWCGGWSNHPICHTFWFLAGDRGCIAQCSSLFACASRKVPLILHIERWSVQNTTAKQRFRLSCMCIEPRGRCNEKSYKSCKPTKVCWKILASQKPSRFFVFFTHALADGCAGIICNQLGTFRHGRHPASCQKMQSLKLVVAAAVLWHFAGILNIAKLGRWSATRKRRLSAKLCKHGVVQHGALNQWRHEYWKPWTLQTKPKASKLSARQIRPWFSSCTRAGQVKPCGQHAGAWKWP